MNYLYSTYLYLQASIYFLFFGPLLLLIVFFSPQQMYTMAQLFCKGLFKCFHLKYKIIGEFPKKGPYVLMHNHSSFLDMFFLPIIIKGKFTGVIAAKNFKIPIIGSILKQIKGIPIIRSGDVVKALKSIKIAEDRIKEGFHVAILPEGTRTLTGKLLPFKKGGFHMAINTKTKILPIVIKGLYKIKPRHRWSIKTGLATMIIEKPIDVANKSIDQLIEETRNIFLKHQL